MSCKCENCNFTEKRIPAIAFKAKDKETRYLSDGPDCGDWSDEFLDTEVITDSLLIFRTDLQKPTNQDLVDFYNFMKSLPLSNDVDFLKANYDPVEVILTQEQLNIVRARNGW